MRDEAAESADAHGWRSWHDSSSRDAAQTLSDRYGDGTCTVDSGMRVDAKNMDPFVFGCAGLGGVTVGVW